MVDFPAPGALDALAASGVDYCIVHASFLQGADAPEPDVQTRLVPVFHDERHGLIVFALRH